MSYRRALATIVVAALVIVGPPAPATAQNAEGTRYIVVFAGTTTADGAFELGGNFALQHETALALVRAAGGSLLLDLSRQIGVILAISTDALFAQTLRGSALVEEVGEDFSWKQFPTKDEALRSGALVLVDPQSVPSGGPEQTSDPLEDLQWSMKQIRAPQAHAIQAGSRSVDVGILDTGIDGAHLDFVLDGAGSNVDCARGRDFIVLVGPGVGNPLPCVDNNFHGTHVAGIVAAQANGHGVVGVAPNVTLVPVKVCDASGFCYASSSVAGITYAGDAKLDVINMSFFVDDDEILQSTEFKCRSDPKQRAFIRAVERAMQHARRNGVAPVAALGNSDTDLSASNCDTIPAETPGVIGTMALGHLSQKAGYSNFGFGPTDVAAPGGAGTTGRCDRTVLSTVPGNAWGCFQGTSMASPHAAGVAALIVSQFGVLRADGDVALAPDQVQDRLQSTTVDIGLVGYDKCFGHGRVDALRAVLNDTSTAFDASAPLCPEFNE